MEPFVYYWKLKVYIENQAYFKGGSEKNKSRARAAGVKGGRDESTLTKYSITLKSTIRYKNTRNYNGSK